MKIFHEVSYPSLRVGVCTNKDEIMSNLPPGSLGEAEHEGVGLAARQPPQLRSDCRRSLLGEICVVVRAWCVQARRWYVSIHGSRSPGRNTRACPQTPSPA